ncbi:hypothetical protein VNO77_03621 [Canavalia gladiata]|uniref:Uncharacterized protein n=1 Tax=Canavalia gladiata TaxID=3824 RepID=A0AAN9N068_CANGL
MEESCKRMRGSSKAFRWKLTNLVLPSVVRLLPLGLLLLYVLQDALFSHKLLCTHQLLFQHVLEIPLLAQELYHLIACKAEPSGRIKCMGALALGSLSCWLLCDNQIQGALTMCRTEV